MNIYLDYGKLKVKDYKLNSEQPERGLYLCKDLQGKLVVVCVSNDGFIFIRQTYLTGTQIPAVSFYDNFEVIGKIKSMKITDIELEW